MNTLGESLLLALQMIARLDAEVLRVVGLSLRVSITACCVGALAGLLLGAWLAVARFRGHGVLVWMLNTLLALPSVVVGLLVYLLLSRSGPLGSWGILFTPSAMVVAQSILVVPLIAALSRRLVLDALAEGGEQLRSLGASPLQCAVLMLVHERLGLVTVLLTAFGRAVSEVGAVMIVGGNIAGVTRVMTTAIALETSKGDLPLALALGAVLLGVVGIVNLLIAAVQAHAAKGAGSAQPAGTEPGAQGALRAATVATAAPAPPTPDTPHAAPPSLASAAAPAQPLLQLHGVQLRFGSTHALQHVSLTLHRGEHLALIGANGSGKTSLLRVLHGLLPGTAGQRTLLPLQPEGRLPVAAMLFQRPFLLHLSVRSNVLLGLLLRGVPRAERAQRCHAALQRVGLAQRANSPARTLSGGQQQRLALARAWALQPDILFLDEPTASLDPSAKREIEALIADVAAAGVTLVMSTHNLGQVKRLASRVLYLESGRVQVDLPMDQFFTARLPGDAAAFLRGERPWH
jgi:tungstate transport system ATP-binding protein